MFLVFVRDSRAHFRGFLVVGGEDGSDFATLSKIVEKGTYKTKKDYTQNESQSEEFLYMFDNSFRIVFTTFLEGIDFR